MSFLSQAVSAKRNSMPEHLLFHQAQKEKTFFPFPLDFTRPHTICLSNVSPMDVVDAPFD